MVEKVRACEQRTGNKWKPARAPMYNRNAVRLYLGISCNTSCRVLDSAPHRIYKGDWQLYRQRRRAPFQFPETEGAGKQPLCSGSSALFYYIHPGNKVKSESNPEVGVEPVDVIFPYDHLLLSEESCNLGCMVAPELYALPLIALFQPFLILAVAADAALRKNVIQRCAVYILGNIACRVERSLGWTPRAPLPRLVGLHQFGQRLAVDTEGEGLELAVADMDCFHHADRPLLFVHFNLHDGLCLVVEFRADVAARVFIILVLVQDGVDVDLPVVGPLHETGDDVGRFLGRVDVVEQVADAIYNHQTEVGNSADGMVDNGQPHVGREFAQRQHHQVVGILLLGQSRQPQDASQHLLAVGTSLLSVNVEDATLPLGEGGAVVEHRAVRHGRRREGRNVEGLLAFGLSDRGAEVTQRPDYGAVHPQHGGRLLAGVRCPHGRLLDAEGQFLWCWRMVVCRFHCLPVLRVRFAAVRGDQGLVLLLETLRGRGFAGRFQPLVQLVPIDVEVLALFDDGDVVLLDLVVEGRKGHPEVFARLLHRHRNVRVLLGCALPRDVLREQVLHACDPVAQLADHRRQVVECKLVLCYVVIVFMGFNMVQTNGMNSRRPTLTGIIFFISRGPFFRWPPISSRWKRKSPSSGMSIGIFDNQINI